MTHLMGKFLLYIFIIFTYIVGCQSNAKPKNGTDLMKYGIPYTIVAPDDVTLTKIGSGTLSDVNIKNNRGYDVQVYMSDAYTADLAKLKQMKKDQVIEHPQFSKIVEEFDNGFLYEKQADDGNRSFDFMIIKVQGDKEINFQAGNSKPFTETDAKSMIQSVLKGH